MLITKDIKIIRIPGNSGLGDGTLFLLKDFDFFDSVFYELAFFSTAAEPQKYSFLGFFEPVVLLGPRRAFYWHIIERDGEI